MIKIGMKSPNNSTILLQPAPSYLTSYSISSFYSPVRIFLLVLQYFKITPMFDCCKTPSNKYMYQVKIKDNDPEHRYSIQQFPSNKKLPDKVSQSQSIIKLKKSDYDQVYKKYSKTIQKFTDPEFPPNAQSLGKFEEIGDNFEWKRISEIIDSPELFDGVVEPSDIIAGSVKKCYFLSALAALAEEDYMIYRIFENQKYNPMGIYKLKIRVYGTIKEIIVDDYIPVDLEGKPLFSQPKKNEFWVLIVEKVWAKINGSYQKIQSGYPSQVFKAFAYAPTRIMPVTNQQANRQTLWTQLLNESKQKRPICVGTIESPDEEEQQKNEGLVWGHFYSFLEGAELKCKQANEWHKIVKLRNPWGRVEWQGRYSQNDAEFWNDIDKKEKEQFWHGLEKEDDGIFFMGWTDFCKYFDTAHFCYYERDPCYEIQPIYPDRKHGILHLITVRKQGEYIIELHQNPLKKDNKDPVNNYGIENSEINRATILVMKASDFQFIDGAFTRQYDSTVNVDLTPGKYLVYSKIDPIIENESRNRQEWIYPKKITVSIYSKYWIPNIKVVDKNKITPGSRFYNKMFEEHARNNKKKIYDGGKLWISWKQLLIRAGFAYICFGVELTSRNKFFVTFKEKDFNDKFYTLKKPYKGQEQISFEVGPGEQKLIVARVMRGSQKKILDFPPALNVKIKGLDQKLEKS